MGTNATASVGAVVVHHKAPLATVLRSLRESERAAKAHGRDAYCIRVLKRAGGEVGVTGSFAKPKSAAERAQVTGAFSEDNTLDVLKRFAEWLRAVQVSRRAVYHSVQWLRELPVEDHWQDVTTANLIYQFKRQIAAVGEGSNRSAVDLKADAEKIAKAMVDSAHAEMVQQLSQKSGGGKVEGGGRAAARILEDMLVTAEFFARETHSGGAMQ